MKIQNLKGFVEKKSPLQWRDYLEKMAFKSYLIPFLKVPDNDRNYWDLPYLAQMKFTVVCKIVHKFASVWCKTALGEVGVSLP